MTNDESLDRDHRPERRTFLGWLAAASAGAAAAVAPGDLLAAPAAIEADDLEIAARLAGLEFSPEDRAMMLAGVRGNAANYARLRAVPLANEVGPALIFDPAPGVPRIAEPERPRPADARLAALERPAGDAELPFLSLPELGALLRSRRLSAQQLAAACLDRLAALDGRLCAVVEYTRDRALGEAEEVDRELSLGIDRGPLQGLPWGAKDLLSARGYATTWGATPYRDQRFGEDAAVVAKLGEAGAVLAAKLSVGALAWGDVWFGGRTASPWKEGQGSSGSSAGPAATVAAGALPFSIGTETLGSIVSPATRCGVTGLRPTFGRVSRHGAMALSWSMDKIGPLARSVEDCALVLEAIAGADRRDPGAYGPAFRWHRDLDPASVRVGYAKAAFEEERPDREWRAFDLAVLEQLEKLGVALRPIELPTEGEGALPLDAAGFLLGVEAAAAFDELTRSQRDDLLERQSENAWPNSFRQSRLVPAVEYVQANRVRTLAMRRMETLMAEVDVYLCPTYGARNLLLTNLTGHPQVALPNGFRQDGTPTSITFTGRLFGENPMLAIARLYQESTAWHRRRPPLAKA